MTIDDELEEDYDDGLVRIFLGGGGASMQKITIKQISLLLLAL